MRHGGLEDRGRAEVLSNSRRQQTYSVRSQIVSNLGFVGQRVSAAITQFCHHRVKAAMDNMWKEHGYITMKLDKLAAARFGP